jgi:hypothetical protein
LPRLALAIIVVLLTFSVSGLSALVTAEPCTGFEPQPQQHDDRACPPTCVTCGCCAQAVEPVTMTVALVFAAPVALVSFLLPRLPKTTPRDILHVPKPRSA